MAIFTREDQKKPLIWEQKAANSEERNFRLWLIVSVVNLFGAVTLYGLMHLDAQQVTGYRLVIQNPFSDFPFPSALFFSHDLSSHLQHNTPSPYSFGWFIRAPWPDEPISITDVSTAIVLSALSTSLVAAPFISFLSHGWYARFDEFRNSLKDGALFAYLRRFWAARLLDAIADYRVTQSPYTAGRSKPKDDLIDRPQIWPELESESQPYVGRVFARIYQEQFGLLPFLAPFILLVTITYIESVALALINPCAAGIQSCPGYFFGSPANLVISAVSGAFMFTVADSVMSIRRRSLNVSDVYWYALRQFLAVPIAMFFSSALPEHIAGGIVTTTLCFVIALLPVDILFKQLRRVAYVALSSNPNEEQGDQLLKLRGMTSPVVTLFLSEGVYSVEQIATADPVLLAIRTGLPFRLVLIFGSQSIVRRHFGDGSQALSRFGFADASAVHDLVTRSTELSDFESICSHISACLTSTCGPMPVAIVRMKLEHIAFEEYTQMLAKLMPLNVARPKQ